MSGGLAPSKSTVYLSNIPFSLTNNDLHKVLEKHGKVVKVTIVKDKITHKSKGVAFVLFLERDCAYSAVRALNNTEMFGRTLKCSIAKDNGRASEFIRRKMYTDKSRCYECGEEGHLSYNCPKNLLGEREPPPKKKKKKKDAHAEDEASRQDGSEEEDEAAMDSLAATIRIQQQRIVEESARYNATSLSYAAAADDSAEPKRKKYKKDAYFSDEEELEGD